MKQKRVIHEMSQYEKIKEQMKYLYRLDRESTSFQSISRWCSDRITWAYKFKHLTYEQMIELTTEMTRIFKGDY